MKNKEEWPNLILHHGILKTCFIISIVSDHTYNSVGLLPPLAYAKSEINKIN